MLFEQHFCVRIYVRKGEGRMMELLKRTELFRGMDEKVLREAILPAGQIREYGREQCLIAPRQRTDEIGIVVSGRLHILHLIGS